MPGSELSGLIEETLSLLQLPRELDAKSPEYEPEPAARIQALLDEAVTTIEQWIPSTMVAKARARQGSAAAIPWLGIFPADSPGAKDGYYLVFLFAQDGSAVYLSLNQGIEKVKAETIQKRTLELRHRINESQDLLPTIDLNATTARGQKYELGSAVAIRYEPGAVPDDETLRDDLAGFVALVVDLMESEYVFDDLPRDQEVKVDVQALLADTSDLIDFVRAEAGPEMVTSRRDAEAEARDYLNEHVGAMTVEQAKELGRLLNRGWWGKSLKHNRFFPALSAPLMNQMTADIDRFNELTRALWRADDDEALGAANEILTDRKVLPGSGRSYPSILLYIRDNARFSVWFNALDEGLAVLTDYEAKGRAGGIDAYLTYSATAQRFASDYGLEVQEVDAVLSTAARFESQEKATHRKSSEAPTLTEAAFDFLADLKENNNPDWFSENRSRYEDDLRDPLTALFQDIADRYIVGLDPAINVSVKRDEVLARINTRAPDASYYTYMWGAFSRFRKQEDAQLYVAVGPESIDFGFVIGAEAQERLETMRSAVETFPDAALDEYLGEIGNELIWSANNADPLTVASAADMRQWVAGPQPTVRQYLQRGDPLIGSAELADRIGELLVHFHPLAAMGWGDAVVLEPSTSSDEPEQTAVSFEELQEKTSLPGEMLEEWIKLLEGPKKAALLYGPPGTGKTHTAEILARYLAGADGESQTVQFHPSFSYEDFIEGLRPVMEDGVLGYEVRPGVFNQFCERARRQKGTFVFVIDEINRAELGSVLGEVMMLIEYRERAVPLPYSQKRFSIPSNVVLLATMNTADRSLALVDFALRRRFHAFSMLPRKEVLEAWSGPGSELALAMFDLVQASVPDSDYAPGHTYWMTDDQSAHSLELLWRYELRPYLGEYWYENQALLDQLDVEVLTLLADGI